MLKQLYILNMAMTELMSRIDNETKLRERSPLISPRLLEQYKAEERELYQMITEAEEAERNAAPMSR